MVTEAPKFAKSASHVSDVRFSHTLTDDRKTIAFHFDNFVVALRLGGAPVAAHTLSMTFPLTDNTGAVAKVTITGSAGLETGSTGAVIFRAFGETHVLEPLLGPADQNPGNFTKELTLDVPAGANLDMTLIVIAERAGEAMSDTLVTLDGVDIALGLADAK